VQWVFGGMAIDVVATYVSKWSTIAIAIAIAIAAATPNV
jgi:hypothetical protein